MTKEYEVRTKIEATDKELLRLTEHYNESTGLSWFWALCFGPLWFLFIGKGWWALALLIACILTYGIAVIAAPFLAYPAHSSVARKKAEKIVSLS